MLFELGSGRDLFRKDLSNDDLVGSPNALLAWVGISDASLAEIFASPEAVEHCDGDFRGCNRALGTSAAGALWPIHDDGHPLSRC